MAARAGERFLRGRLWPRRAGGRKEKITVKLGMTSGITPRKDKRKEDSAAKLEKRTGALVSLSQKERRSLPFGLSSSGPVPAVRD